MVLQHISISLRQWLHPLEKHLFCSEEPETWNHYTCPKMSTTEGAIKKMKLIKNAGSNPNEVQDNDQGGLENQLTSERALKNS